nr:hypothetical protein [Candidatus Freyarchaeota archaeon]
MNPITSWIEKLRNKDPKHVSLLVFIAILIIFNLLTYYSFDVRFTWILTYVPYYNKYYLFFINTNIMYLGVSLLKAAIFTAILTFAAIISIKISQTSSIAQIITGPKKEKMQSTEIIQRWKINKKITSTALILQYVALIILAGITLLIWYNMLQQYIIVLPMVSKYVITLIAALGVTYLINPPLDDEKMLAQACLNTINSIEEGYEKKDVKKIDLAYFMLYVLLNQALSKYIEELEEFDLEPPLTTLYLALLHNERETLTKAKTIATNLLKAITQQKIQNILKHLNEIDKKLGNFRELAETMKISVSHPSPTIYTFNSSNKLVRLRAIIPLITETALAILIFLVKWLYYITF